jgi:hypothetical protein
VLLTNDVPGAIVTAVVDKHHQTIGSNLLLADEFTEQRRQSLYGLFQHQFLVIAWRYGSKSYHAAKVTFFADTDKKYAINVYLCTEVIITS